MSSDAYRMSMRSVVAIGVVSLWALGASVAHGATTATLLPTSAGSFAQWTPSTGATHYTLVDETTCNGLTDYVSETTVGERNSFGVSLSSIPDGSTITAVQITPCASRASNGGGSATMNLFYRFNGVNSADQGAYALTGTTPGNLAATNFTGLSLAKLSSSTFEIGAVYSAGTKGARLSRIATVITYTAPLPPAAPTNAAATNVSGTSNTVTWTDNATNETAYNVQRSANGGAYVSIATTSADATSYTDTTASADTTYTYRVRAYNLGGYSAESVTGYVVTATVAPTAPTLAYFVSSSTPPDVNVYITHSGTNEDGFVVERSVDGVNFSAIATPLRTLTSFQFYADVNPGSGTYYYRVYAFNAVGNSANSNTETVIVP